MVKGQDRAPTDLVDKVVEQLGQRTTAQRAAITNSLWTFGVGVALGFAAVVVLAAFLSAGSTCSFGKRWSRLAKASR